MTLGKYMNRKKIITTCFLAIAVASVWLTFPWEWHIQQRVSKIGSATMTKEFDAWWIGIDKGRSKFSVESLPPSLHALKPLEVRREADGVYLVMKRMFVIKKGVFITVPGTTSAYDTGTDPSMHSLGGRVYYYHIRG